jgi:hypothetical protein
VIRGIIVEAAVKLGLGLVKMALDRDWSKKVYLHENPRRLQRLSDSVSDLDRSARRLREHALQRHLAGARRPPDRVE